MTDSKCERCGLGPRALVRNRHENICLDCMDAEIASVGVNVLVVPWQPGRSPWVYNTARDADKVYPLNPVGTKFEVADGRDMKLPKRKD